MRAMADWQRPTLARILRERRQQGGSLSAGEVVDMTDVAVASKVIDVIARDVSVVPTHD